MNHRIQRRSFLTLLGGAAAVWPVVAGAQQSGRLPTIGYMGTSTPTLDSRRREAFVQRLRDLGWTDARTVAIEYRWGEGRNERFDQIAAEFVRLKVNVIVTGAAAPVFAAKRATSTIPIVFAAQSDPIGSGLVASLSRPGGNITGLSVQLTDTAGKRVELLREVLPNLRRLAIVANANGPGAMLEMVEAKAAARSIGLDSESFEVRSAEDIAGAFEAFKGRAEALYICGDPLMIVNRVRINTLAKTARLPTMYTGREAVEAGGLISYGPNQTEAYRRAAEFVDKILRGTKAR